MKFSQIGCDCFGDAAAQFAVDAANAAVLAIDAEQAAIVAESEALIDRAMSADAEDTAKILKAAQAMWARKLKCLLMNAKIPALLTEAELAVRNAATTRTTELEQKLAVVEERLGKAAGELGYKAGDAMHHRVLHGDAPRRELMNAIRETRQAISKTRFISTEDAERVNAELRKEIAGLLG